MTVEQYELIYLITTVIIGLLVLGSWIFAVLALNTTPEER